MTPYLNHLKKKVRLSTSTMLNPVCRKGYDRATVTDQPCGFGAECTVADLDYYWLQERGSMCQPV